MTDLKRVTAMKLPAFSSLFPSPGRIVGRWVVLMIAMALALSLSAGPVLAQDRVEDFKRNCVSCHTIGGGRLVGPDLKDVSQRKDRAWLSRFIMDPKGVLDSGDAYALKMKDDARGALMTNIPGMTLERAMNLLDLIEAESALEKSQFEGIKLSDRPFTPVDVAAGREMFLGNQRLANGGPSCVSCHSVNGIGVLAGGKLGPDLNAVFERLNGRKGLATWLSAPATSTMQAVFEEHPLEAEEILPLVAYLADMAVAPPESGQAATLIFTLLGLAGTAAALVLFDATWRNRFRAVRRPLVYKRTLEGKG
jgi:mono/diheme cytochrome c family protein